MKFKILFYCGLCLTSFGACASKHLITKNVAYQSVRTANIQPIKDHPIPDDAKIAVIYSISQKGELTAVVVNRTSEIMMIDQTMSFFVNSDGMSTSYYDPTVRTTSTTDMSSSTKGGSVNLGAIGGALGIGGVFGTALNGINVGGSGTSGQSVTNSTYVADMPRVSLAPKSNGVMSKTFSVKGIGEEFLTGSNQSLSNLSENESYCKFSVCISYSIDGGSTFDKLVTNFYANSKIIVSVDKNGVVNDALRQIFLSKTDAIHETWWMLYFNNNIPERDNVFDTKVQGVLYDYK